MLYSWSISFKEKKNTFVIIKMNIIRMLVLKIKTLFLLQTIFIFVVYSFIQKC